VRGTRGNPIAQIHRLVRALAQCFVSKSRDLPRAVHTFNGCNEVSRAIEPRFEGFTQGGFAANMIDIAPRQAAIVMGISNTVATVRQALTTNRDLRHACFGRSGQQL